MATPVLEICLLIVCLQMTKFSLRTMYYSPWGSKNKIGSKKIMQVEVGAKCMQTNFSVRDLSGFIIYLCIPCNLFRVFHFIQIHIIIAWSHCLSKHWITVVMQNIIVSVEQFVIDNITNTIRRMRLKKIIDGHNI